MTDGWSVADRFVMHARLRPDAPALVWHRGEISYGELHDMAERASVQLEWLAPGQHTEPVGVLAHKSPAAVALVLACLLARRPFLLPSPALDRQSLAKLFAQAGCRHVLVPDEETGAAPVDEVPLSRGPAEAVGADVSFMLTTSGSTGLPKIVPLARDAVDRFVDWAGAAFDIRPGRTVLNFAPLNFDLCLLDVWTTLARGGRVVLVDPEYAADGRHLLGLLRSHEVHVVQAVPMFFGLLLEALSSSPEGPGAEFGAVEHVMFTGDVIPDRVLAKLPGLFPGARLYNIYGCTETNDSFIHEVDTTAPLGPLPIGEPLPGVSSFVVDEDGRLVEGAGTGELHVSTPFQTAGYLDRSRHTDKFAPHPLGLDDRPYFRTGDLVRREDDGRMLLVGRSDFQVKVRGVAINTAEVEHILLEHPDVLEAAVVTVPDPVTGRRLLCAVQRAPSSGLNSLALREHCVRRLPKAAIPSVMRIAEDPLPKTSTGKVDRNAANHLHESPQPERRVS
ncbi:AMP-binding protein [Streptosporangium sp. NPDC051023]|uniref:AMP-binding protein n=1 Tax=Streptosporangium sp. NPDC051023 TaxID=3155410 RepID=UPI00344CB1B8